MVVLCSEFTLSQEIDFTLYSYINIRPLTSWDRSLTIVPHIMKAGKYTDITHCGASGKGLDAYHWTWILAADDCEPRSVMSRLKSFDATMIQRMKGKWCLFRPSLITWQFVFRYLQIASHCCSTCVANILHNLPYWLRVRDKRKWLHHFAGGESVLTGGSFAFSYYQSLCIFYVFFLRSNLPIKALRSLARQAPACVLARWETFDRNFTQLRSI